MKTGDLIAKWAGGQTLSPGEIEEMRRGMNDAQNMAAIMAQWSAPSGSMNQYLFQQYGPSGGFSQLPTPCASVNAGPISVPNDAWTYVAFDMANAATIGNGLGISSAGISVTGIDRASWTDIVCWAGFNTNSSGIRGVRWITDTGDALTSYMTAISSDTTTPILSHKRRIKSDYTMYRMQLFQNSGAALDCAQAYMAVSKIR